MLQTCDWAKTGILVPKTVLTPWQHTMQQESTQAKGPEGNALMPQSQEKCCVGKELSQSHWILFSFNYYYLLMWYLFRVEWPVFRMESVVTHFPSPHPQRPSLQRATVGGWGGQICRGGGGALCKLGHSAHRRCLHLDCDSARGMLPQSNNAIPGGSTGLVETKEEAARPMGFQGNLISSTCVRQKARAAK